MHVVSQPSSPLDPMFWVMHPTIERLWAFKHLLGTVADTTWPDDLTEYTAWDSTKTSVEHNHCAGHGGSDVFPFGLLGDKEVANFAGLQNDVGASSTVDNYNRIYAMSFASSNEVYDFGRMHGVGKAMANDPVNTLTNREVLENLDPRNNRLSYIYDTFNWDHCVADGVDFNGPLIVNTTASDEQATLDQ